LSTEIARAPGPKAVLIIVVLGLGAFSLLGAGTAAATVITQNRFQFQAAAGPAAVDVPPYSATPVIPSQWIPVQSATVALTNDAPGSWGFALGTSTYVGLCVFARCGAGYGAPEAVAAFPSSLSDLSNNAVSCLGSTPHDTPYAIANSTLYLPIPATIHVDTASDDGATVSYSNSSSHWTSVLGSGWVTGDTSGSMALYSGYYSVAVAWYNSCGPGEIAVQFSGLPTGAYFTTVPPPTVSTPPTYPLSASQALSSCEIPGPIPCVTSFLVFSTGQTGSTVTLSTAAGPALVSKTNGAPVAGGICALPVNLTVFGCLAGETGQFVVFSGVNYAYTVTYSDGTSVSGTVAAVAPWTVHVITVDKR
jgi:hypothetical protein